MRVSFVTVEASTVVESTVPPSFGSPTTVVNCAVVNVAQRSSHC
jgi:hypothetical protein